MNEMSPLLDAVLPHGITQTLAFHPASQIFELLSGEDFDALVKSVQKNGLREPIWLHPDGTILDGRNRYRACLAANVVPVFETWDGIGSAADFVWDLNFLRRHLDGGAKQMAAGRYAIELEREARQRQGARTDLVVAGQTSAQTCAEVDFGPSRDKAAKKFGVGTRTVDSAIAVAKHGVPELADRVESGDVSVSAAAEIATLQPSEQREIIARGEKEILEASKAIRLARAAERRAANDELKASIVTTLPDGVFETIVIDPPWEMEKIDRDVRPNQVAFDYPTMTEEELGEFRLPDMAADDCHLFCWTTQKFLPSALRLIEVWGFRYVLTMVWHKSGGFQPIGLPQYNCEFAVYARRGTPSFVETKAFPCCFYAERREHSRKPDEFYEIIRRVTGGPRIDVFSRGPHDGFARFGNETEKFAS